MNWWDDADSAEHGESSLYDAHRCRRCDRYWCVWWRDLRDGVRSAWMVAVGAACAAMSLGFCAAWACARIGGGVAMQIACGVVAVLICLIAVFGW